MTIGLMMVIVYLLGVIFFLKELFTRGHHFVGFYNGGLRSIGYGMRICGSVIYGIGPQIIYIIIDEGHKCIQNSIHPTANLATGSPDSSHWGVWVLLHGSVT